MMYVNSGELQDLKTAKELFKNLYPQPAQIGSVVVALQVKILDLSYSLVLEIILDPSR